MSRQLCILRVQPEEASLVGSIRVSSFLGVRHVVERTMKGVYESERWSSSIFRVRVVVSLVV